RGARRRARAGALLTFARRAAPQMLASAALPSSTPPLVRLARRLPGLVELALVGAAIAWLVPLFGRIVPLDPGRDQRFLDRGIAVAGLPEPVLAATCAALAPLAASEVATPRCSSRQARAAPHRSDGMPAPLAAAVARASQAF